METLLAASSPTGLLPRTLGPAASPSRTCGAPLDLPRPRPLKGSKELVRQARLALKEHGDIEKLSQDGGVKVAAAANGRNNQQGRRPAMDRKRSRFTIKATTSNPVENVDFSELLNIEDPEEYFLTLEQLEKADKEIKKLRGEAPTKTASCHQVIDPPKVRPGMLRRKSVHPYKFSGSVDIPDATEAPASQVETRTESQFSQDEVNASVPSKSSQNATPDVSMREESFAGKNKGATLDYLLSSFKNLDEAEEENLLRETLQLKEINIEKVCLPGFSVPGDRPVRSSILQKNPISGRTPERPVSGSDLARISQLEKSIFAGDVLKDLQKDDSDESPESVVRKQPLLHSSLDPVVLTTSEACTPRETPSPSAQSPHHVLHPEMNVPNDVTIDERQPETPSSSAQSPDHVLQRELNVPNDVTIDERQPESSQLGGCRDSGVAKEKDASSRKNVFFEEEDVPMHDPIVEKSNHETEVSSPHHLEGGSTELLASTPGRSVSSLHKEDVSFDHQEVVQEVLQGVPRHSSEIPAEDIDPQNQPRVHDRNTKKLADDISNALSPGKIKKQKAGRKRKNKELLKRRERVIDEPTHSLDIPSTNSDPENEPHMQDINAEQQTVGVRDPQSQKKGKVQNEAQTISKKQESDRRYSLSGAGHAYPSGVRRSTRIRSRPLQYWLGEKFVYGRVHKTLATVIGVKSYSPSQDGKAALRVKSFVSEEYSDYLAKSAKY